MSPQVRECSTPEPPGELLISSRGASATNDSPELSIGDLVESSSEEKPTASRAHRTVIDQTCLSQELLWSPVENPADQPSPQLPMPSATTAVPPLITPTKKTAIVSVKFSKEIDSSARNRVRFPLDCWMIFDYLLVDDRGISSQTCPFFGWTNFEFYFIRCDAWFRGMLKEEMICI